MTTKLINAGEYLDG